jgi:rubrerythrin
MSCLEHECRCCGYFWANNNPQRRCPQCGSQHTSVYCDEQDDHYEPEEEYDE